VLRGTPSVGDTGFEPVTSSRVNEALYH